MLSNVSLSVGAPVRVYLHSLVRRLLYSHLTPSTLSSPSLPPSSVLQCTPILTLPSPLTALLHGWICLVLQSMHVCCLPWQTPQMESLLSLPHWAAEARRRPGASPLENDHTCRGSQNWGWQGDSAQTLLTVVWNSVFYLEYLVAQTWCIHISWGNINGAVKSFDWIYGGYFCSRELMTAGK